MNPVPRTGKSVVVMSRGYYIARNGILGFASKEKITSWTISDIIKRLITRSRTVGITVKIDTRQWQVLLNGLKFQDRL
jgi:hypothetical protein